MLRSGFGKPSPRIEQILYDNGLFLVWDHALLDICIRLHHSSVYPDRDGAEEVHFLGYLQQQALFHPYRLTPINIYSLLCRILPLFRPVAHVHFGKSSLCLKNNEQL